MSPTKTMYKEDLLVVADLDIANAKDGEISVDLVLPKSSPAFRLADKSAIEHEELSAVKLPISEALSEEEDAECCKESLEENEETSSNNALSSSTLVNDLQYSNHTPSCLNTGTNELDQSSNDNLISLESFASSSDANDTGASLGDVKQKVLQKKRKKKTKSHWKKSSKKRRTTHFGQNGCCKVASGGTQTNQTGNATDGATPVAAGPSTARAAPGNPGNQGGGGGDGGEDGDGQRNNKKQSVHNVPLKAASSRKKRTSSDEIDVDGDGDGDVVSSSDGPMDVDPKLSEKQVGDVRMVDANPHGERPEEKPPRADEKSSKLKEPVPTQELLIESHCGINHFAYCKKNNCKRCSWVHKLLCFHLKERKNGCACKQCNVRSEILQFHRKKCNISWCGTCAELKLAPNLANVQKGVGVKNVGQNVRNVGQNARNVGQNARNVILNTPLSANSLDTNINEAVIFKNDSLQELDFFKEHEDFTFKATKMVGSGANGEVHDVILDPEFKNKHLPFAKDKFVLKKTVVDEDELKVLKHISNHPNFVKTYLVANKNDGKFKQVILMEKCDLSLRDYIKTKEKGPKGEILDRYEAMHYWTQVLDAVVYLHHHLHIPAIHKDIKSANVLLTCNLVRAKLADFDAVMLLRNEYTQPGLVPKGTKYFVAPEVAKQLVHGRPADIYSMGIFLLELLFGSLVKTPEVPLRLLKEIDYDLAELIARCLKFDPQERPTAIEIQNHTAVTKYMKKDPLP